MLDRTTKKRSHQNLNQAQEPTPTPPPIPGEEWPRPGEDIHPESNIATSTRLDLAHFFQDADLYEALTEEAATRRTTVDAVMQSAVADYLSGPAKKRTRHDYAPHPSCAVLFRADSKTFCELEALAARLGTYVEHAAYIALRRYLDQREPLEVVEVKTGKGTTDRRIRGV